MAKAVAAILGVEGGVEEEDAVRQGVRQVSRAGVQDALGVAAYGGEAAESDAEREAQMVCGGFGVGLLDILGQRRALGAVDGGLCPVLGVAPGGRPRTAELDGRFTMRFVKREGGLQYGKDDLGIANL
jgi:hypothetical protein